MNRTRTLAFAAATVVGLGVAGTATTAFAQTTATYEAGAKKPPGPRGLIADAAATALGLSKEELKTELKGGKTVAQVAQEKGVDPQTVVTAVSGAMNAAIDQAVTDGKLTAQQAATMKSKVGERASNFVNNTRPPKAGNGDGPRGRGARFGDPLATAATALGMSQEELRSALQGNKTIAQVATERGVDPNTVITALTNAANAAIDQAVTDGRLTAEQATNAKAKAAEHSTRIVNEGRPRRGGR